MNFIYWTLLILVIIYLGIALFYYFFQNRFIFARFGIYGKYRFRLDIPHKEIMLKSEEGETLHGLWIKVKNPKGLLIYFHGNTGSLKRWGKTAAEFTNYGYDVLAPDYRGYGKSTGKPSEVNLINDAHIFYQFALKRYKEEDIVVYGRSLGSGVAVQLAATVKPRIVFLETPFSSILEVVQSTLPFIPFKLLLKYPFMSIDYIERVKSEIVILAGKIDTQVPYKSSLKLYNKVAHRKDVHFYSFKKGDHNTLASFKKYKRVMEEFLCGKKGFDS
jgi:fermentation-respiration switch protein FrsA (DUF1100 family)